MATKKRRLIPIIDRRFQFKYTAIIFSVAAVVSAALGFLLLDAYTELNKMLDLSDPIKDQLNADDARRVFTLVIGFLAAEVLLIGVAGLLITHRVCGPIVVLHRHLGTLLDGRYPILRGLRSGDEFVSTFETFSELVNALRERDEREAEELKALLTVAAAQGLDPDHVSTLQRLLDEREQRMQKSEAA
jgi:signal transduction histidine kinase